MIPIRRLALVTFPLLLAAPMAAQSGGVPASGAEVLERMRAKYAKHWYHTLEFSQRTTLFGRNTVREEIWHERLWQSPTRGTLLRIDAGDPALGNSTINTADSGYVIRGGKLVQASANGNFFLPLIEGVYLQPVERTVRDLASAKIDLSKVYAGEWQHEKVWVVGAASPSDTLSPQFWVERKRLVVVRVLIVLAPGQPPLDVHLDKYVKTGGGWLATSISMFTAGKPRQLEDYYGWKSGISIDPAVFEAPPK
jgi:hypothetical protein